MLCFVVYVLMMWCWVLVGVNVLFGDWLFVGWRCFCFGVFVVFGRTSAGGVFRMVLWVTCGYALGFVCIVQGFRFGLGPHGWCCLGWGVCGCDLRCVLRVFCLVFWGLVSCCGTPSSFYVFVRFVLGVLFIGFVVMCMLLLGLFRACVPVFWGVLVVWFGVCGFGMVVLCFLLF